MARLENDVFKIEINEEGGALSSIYDKKNQNELLYQPDPRSWQGQDVVIFPFIARLKGGIYTVDGQEYSMKNHGIPRYTTLDVKFKDQTTAILSLRSNAETLKIYPFDFEFMVMYKLENNKLSIRYKIVNTGNKTMYYEMGGHPALRVSGVETESGFDIKDTKLLFLKEYETNRYYLDETGSLIIGKSVNRLPREIEVTKKLITDAKTVILDANGIDGVALLTRGYAFEFDIHEAPVLALWTMPGFGDYLCVEPWWGIPDIQNPNMELSDKPMIRHLNPSESEEVGYSIEIIKYE